MHNIRRLLLLAAFVYFFISPLTYHSDNKLVLSWASQDQGRVWDIWRYGASHFMVMGQFNYPPLHFYLDKVQYAVSSLVAGPDFTTWLASSNATDSYQPNLARYAAANKLVLILFGLVCGYLIYLIARQAKATPEQANLAAALWLFNPITIYSVPMMGQNDVMAIAFFLLGWWVLQHQQWRTNILASVLFGLAASIKMYPLLWVFFLACVTPQLKIKQKILVVGLSVAVFGLTLLPFISNSVFRTAVLTSDINDRFLYSQINLGFDEAVNLVPLLLLALLFAILAIHKNRHWSVSGQAFVLLTVNLLMLGFSHFHPQWFTWLIPFWALWLVFQTDKQKIYVSSFLATGVFAAWLAVVLLFKDLSLNLGMLMVMNPALANLPVLSEALVKAGANVGKFNNLAHTALAGVGALALLSFFQTTQANAQKTFSGSLPKIIRQRYFVLPKIIRFVLASLVIAGATFLSVLVLQLVPAPQASLPPAIQTDVKLVQSTQMQFTAEADNFYRFDLFLRNPSIQNQDDFEVSVLDQSQREIFHQVFSGQNVGDPLQVRFDLRQPLEHSKGQIYTIKLTPVVAVNPTRTDLLHVQVTDKNNPNSMAVRSYYKSSRKPQVVMLQAWQKIQQVGEQLPVYYLFVWGLLFFGV